MRKSVLVLAVAPLALSACVETGAMGASAGGPTVQLSENVLAIAAPYQDLSTVKINEADGCYVYRHVGPVETTYLPLRAKNGRPICTRAPDAAA